MLPDEIYELIAQGARYWFLLLMALIVWRSYRWYRRDKRQAKKRLKLLPDAGYVGEMVVMQPVGELKRGDALPVPWEGTLGALRTNDLCLPVGGVGKKHLWFRYDEGRGLLVAPLHGRTVKVDDETCSRREQRYMAHGSRLFVGEAELRLRLFAGFESMGHAPLRERAAQPTHIDEPQEQPSAQAAASQEQLLRQVAYQQWMLQQQMQHMAYQQWMLQQQAMQAAQADDDPDDDADALEDVEIDETDEPHAHSAEPTPQGAPAEAPEQTFYPAEPDGDADWPYAPYPQSDAEWEDTGYTYPDLVEPGEWDEDMTDAAAPPKSAYVGHDEAEQAKRKVWDRYFGGGRPR